MLNSNGPQRFVADFRVSINGSELPRAAYADLMSVAVYEDVDALSMFTLHFANWSLTESTVTWSDDALMSPGNEVEVKMGYVDQLESLLKAEITGLEPEFIAGEVPSVIVRGYDRRHRLMRGRKTKSFTQVKDSDIASQIATDAGLSSQVKDTGVTLDYVLQHNQTDYEFLQARARRIGYEVAIDDKTLLFQPFQNTQSETLTLELDDLLEFSPRLTSVGQVGGVDVRGWNVKDKEAIVAQASAGGLASTMGGASTGPSAADGAFGAATMTFVTYPVFTRAEADKIAQGQLEDMALAYIMGEGQVEGTPDLRAGSVIKLKGIGARFSGLYYVTATAHVYSPHRGYRTSFSIRRNAT